MANSFGAYNSNFYAQELQGMRDNIDRRLQQYQQSQNQLMQQQPQIQQTFQLSNPMQNNSVFDGKYVDGIDEVKNTLVFKNSLFLNKDMTKMWFKDTNGNVRMFNLEEEIQVDENIAEINDLKKELNDLKALLVQQMNNKQPVQEQQPLAKIEPVTKVVKKK